MKMKIVHVVEPLAGGIVTFLSSLVENMPDDIHIFVHGERPTVMPFTEVRKRFSKTNVRFIRWYSAQRSLHPRKDLAAFFELHHILKRLMQNGDLDAVHLHSSKSGFLGRLVCRTLGVRNVIYTPNGAPFMVGSSPAVNFLYKQLEKFASIFGGQVVCCSPSEQIAYHEAGIKAIAINNGIVPISAGSTKPPGQPAAFSIVSSGRIIHQKNPELFNRIARYFLDLPQFRFIWVGDGPDRNLLDSSNIEITGWLPREQANRYVAASDVYLSTAHFEGLSFAVLEAMSMKKPVILTDCVGNRDLVNGRLNGDLFSHEKEAIVKILQYCNNSRMLDVMGSYSARHCDESFNINQTSEGYRNLYSRQRLAI